jgi:predicted  nucleic acid-binding Zn-ribbon protein
MFNTTLRNTVTRLEKKVAQLKEERENLLDSISGHTREIESIRVKNKRDEEDIRHMVKMASEANELKYKQRVMDNDKLRWEGIAVVKDEYRTKLEERLNKEVVGIKEMYQQVLERLPNINAKLNMKG